VWRGYDCECYERRSLSDWERFTQSGWVPSITPMDKDYFKLFTISPRVLLLHLYFSIIFIPF